MAKYFPSFLNQLWNYQWVEGEEETDGFIVLPLSRKQMAGVITISTMVEYHFLQKTEYFQSRLDPSLTTTTTAHGYCRTTHNYCGIRGSAASYTGVTVAHYGKYAPGLNSMHRQL